MSPSLHKTSEYIEALLNEDATLPDSVFETSASLGSECLSMTLFYAYLKDMFPTLHLRPVLFMSFKQVHATRMRQKHLAIFDSAVCSSSKKMVYFCKQKNVAIASSSMILDGSVLLFGVIASDVIKSTISVLHDLWRPVVDIDRSAWGVLDFDRMQEFFQARGSLTDILNHTIRESASKIRLAYPDESLDIDHIPLHRDAVNVELQRILTIMVNSWCDEIDAAIAHREAFFEDMSLPPVEEIYYWINRCDALGAITEQLKVRERRHCAALIGIVENNRTVQAAVKRFRNAEKALAENFAEALDTKSHLAPFERVAVSIQNSNIDEVSGIMSELMRLITTLALECRRYGPGLSISLFLGKFCSSIERCIVLHVRGDLVSTQVMFWSRTAFDIMELLGTSIGCVDKYKEAVDSCRASIHVQQVALNSQNYSAASKVLPSAIHEDIACQHILKFRQLLVNLQTALQWQVLFSNCAHLRPILTLQYFFEVFEASASELMALELNDLFDFRSKRLHGVLSSIRLAKDALLEACLGYVNAELHAQDTVERKIDILELHRDLLAAAGATAMTMVEEHSLAIVQVSCRLIETQ